MSTTRCTPSRIRFEWRYTYHSARRDGWNRRAALRRFVREVVAR